MAKYRKRPVIIDAYQTDKKIVIHTLEGDMTASPGDYIITGLLVLMVKNILANLIYLQGHMNR